jgi:hypothetical protein
LTWNPVNVTGVSNTGNPCTITTAVNHNFTTGDEVELAGFDTIVAINGLHTITVTGATTFTIPENVTVVTDGVGTAEVTSKSYLGCSWTNGETKEVYPITYNLDYNPRPTVGTTMNIHHWGRITDGDKLRLNGTTNVATTTFSDALLGEIDVTRNQDTNFDLNFRVSYWFGSRYSTLVNNTNVSSYAPAMTAMTYGVPLGTNRTGSVTTNDGLTIAWTQGAGW